MKQVMLTEAMEADDIQAVAALLRDGARLEACNGARQTLLFHAASYCSSEVVDLLLAAGANPHHRDVFAQTPLHCAVRYRSNPGCVALLLRAGSDPDARNNMLETPLHHVRDIATLRLLLEAGADPNAADETQETPLHRMAADRGPDMVEALLKAGANPNAADKHGKRPLHSATNPYNEHAAQIVTLLIGAGARLEARNQYGKTALHTAAFTNSTAAMGALLDAGANLNARTIDGQTPLHLAAEQYTDENDRMLGMLLRAGADVNARDGFDSTPLHGAAVWGTETAYLMIALAGGDTQALNGSGDTPEQLFMDADREPFG